MPSSGERVVVVFLRVGSFDETLPMSAITDVALRAAIAKLPSGNAVRDATVEGLQSTILLAGEQHEITETLRGSRPP